MPTNELPPRYKIMLAETVSWLAWGRCFSREDFLSAASIKQCRREIRQYEKILKRKHGSNKAKSPNNSLQESMAFYQQALERGKSLLPQFKEASGFNFTWPKNSDPDPDPDPGLDLTSDLDDSPSLDPSKFALSTLSDPFQASISDVLLKLWDAATSEQVKVWGKPYGGKDVDEQQISPRLFTWEKIPPVGFLTFDYIQFMEGAATKDNIWTAINFEKPAIEALRAQNLPRPQQASDQDTPEREKATNGLTPGARREDGDGEKSGEETTDQRNQRWYERFNKFAGQRPKPTHEAIFKKISLEEFGHDGKRETVKAAVNDIRRKQNETNRLARR